MSREQRIKTKLPRGEYRSKWHMVEEPKTNYSRHGKNKRTMKDYLEEYEEDLEEIKKKHSCIVCDKYAPELDEGEIEVCEECVRKYLSREIKSA